MNKRIGITCTTVFHYVHFAGIANELEKKGYDVEYIIYTPYHINQRVERLEEVFKANKVKYYGFEKLFNNSVTYDIILAPYYMPGFQLLDKKIKKIRILYGYAKDAWNYAEWNRGFDLVLSYGPYATRKLQGYTSVEEIGHPRLSKSYLKEIVDINNKVLKKDVLTDKKTLVYCPTWADLSSLDIFNENVNELLDRYNLIVKLHHGNVLSGDSDKWLNLKNKDNLYLFDEYTNLFDLLQFADIILSDYSGAIFDAMLFRKPIVLLDIISDDVMDTGTVNLNKMANISLYNNKDLNNKSLDIKIREYLPHVRNVDDLFFTLNEALKNNIPYADLLEDLYSFQDDKANLRAANAIEKVNRQEKDKWDTDDSFHILNEKAIREYLKKHNESLKVWGAGLSGQIIVAWIQSQGIQIQKLMDADVLKQGKSYLDYVIEEPIVESGIILTVTGAGLNAIREICSKKGLVEGIDYISIFK